MGFIVTYDDFTGIEESDPISLSIYPNPANNFVFIENDEDGNILELLDQTGRVLHSQILSQGSNYIDLTGISPGLYFARLNEMVQRLVVK